MCARLAKSTPRGKYAMVDVSRIGNEFMAQQRWQEIVVVGASKR